jgi:hypothetical protein
MRIKLRYTLLGTLINGSLRRVVKLYILFLILVHWIGCFWFFMSERSVHWDIDMLDGRAGARNNWISVMGIEAAEISTQYITSVYWAATTICTIGFGVR